MKSRYHSIRPLSRNVHDVKKNIRRVITDMNASDTLDYESFYNNMRNYLDLAFQGRFF